MQIKTIIRWILIGVGLALVTFALSTEWFRLNPNNGWGPKRQIVLFIGILFLLIIIFYYLYKFILKIIILIKKKFSNPWLNAKLSRPTDLNESKLQNIAQRVTWLDWPTSLSFYMLTLLSSYWTQRINLFGSVVGVQGNDHNTTKNKLESLIFSIVLIVIIFFDVIFLGTTVSQNRALFPIRYAPDGTTPLIREDLFAKWGELSGESDNGASRWQAEPGICYLHFLLNEGESPYWDPYSSAGMPGVETMADVKFSPISLIVALMGCNVKIYNFIIIFIQIIAVYFMNRILRFHFGFSSLAGMVGCIVYLLNGFYIMNLNSQVVQNWLYFPIVLYFLIDFCKKPTVYRFIGMVIGNILILLVTFMPTTAMLMVCVYILSFCFILGYHSSIKQYLFIFIAQLFSVVAAVSFLSFLYLPIYESFTIPHLYDFYFVYRDFRPLDIGAFLSFFSGKHFVSALQFLPLYKSPGGIISWYFGFDRIFYFGLITGFILIQTWGNKIYRKDPIIIGLSLLFLFALGRLFQFPLIYQLWDVIPMFKTFGGPYIWSIIAFCIIFFVGYGFETLSYEHIFRRWPILLVMNTLLVFWIAYAYYWLIARTGAPIGSINWVYITILLVLLIIPQILFYLIYINNTRLNLYRGMLVLLLFSELFFYMNGTRLYRLDSSPNMTYSPAVSFIKKNIGLNRIANYGSIIWPQLGSAYQIQQIEGENPGTLPWYLALFNGYLGGGNSLFAIMDTGSTNIDSHVLNLLDVKYMVVDQADEKHNLYFSDAKYPVAYRDASVTIYENPDHYNRVFITHALTGKPFDPNGPIDKLATTDDEKFLSDGNKLGINDKLQPGLSNLVKNEPIQVIQYKNTQITIQAKLDSPGVVILMDTWHPNWKAYANGKEVYVGRVFNAFRGIVLPAGEYTIEFDYQPASMPLVYTLSTFVTIFLVLLIVFYKNINKWLYKRIYASIVDVDTLY